MLTVEYADNVLRFGPLFFKKRAKTSKRSFVGQLVTCVNMGSNQPHLTQKVDFLKIICWNSELFFPRSLGGIVCNFCA